MCHQADVPCRPGCGRSDLHSCSLLQSTEQANFWHLVLVATQNPYRRKPSRPQPESLEKGLARAAGGGECIAPLNAVQFAIIRIQTPSLSPSSQPCRWDVQVSVMEPTATRPSTGRPGDHPNRFLQRLGLCNTQPRVRAIRVPEAPLHGEPGKEPVAELVLSGGWKPATAFPQCSSPLEESAHGICRECCSSPPSWHSTWDAVLALRANSLWGEWAGSWDSTPDCSWVAVDVDRHLGPSSAITDCSASPRNHWVGVSGAGFPPSRAGDCLLPAAQPCPSLCKAGPLCWNATNLPEGTESGALTEAKLPAESESRSQRW